MDIHNKTKEELNITITPLENSDDVLEMKLKPEDFTEIDSSKIHELIIE